MNKLPDRPVVAAEASSVDIERFASNVARMVEQGGKALAAYMKPREQGSATIDFPDQIRDAVKTLGQVLEYWLSDPQRTVELQRRLGSAYLELWGSAVKRMAGQEPTPVATADPKDKRFSDPEWSSNQFFDFLKQLYLLSTHWAEQTRHRSPVARSSHTSEGRVLYPSDRERDLALELRHDQSRTPA